LCSTESDRNETVSRDLDNSSENVDGQCEMLENSSASVDEQDQLDASHVSDIKNVIESIWRDKLCISDCSILQCESIELLNKKLQHVKDKLSAQSRTCKLWLNYVHYVELMKLFLVAERTSDWQLHLHVMVQMLNLFAAAGHNNYAKSARLYVQQMLNLQDSNPRLYEQFIAGKHAIRRSNRLWAGLSSDLVIEQTMMKWAKGRGGLTLGRGMHDSARAMWVNTLSECTTIHMAMSAFTGLDGQSSDHAELGKARMNRDGSDLLKISEYLLVNNPFRFCEADKLVSLSSGVVAGLNDNVNCDEADEVGRKVQESWDNMTYSEITAKRSNRVKTLATLVNACKIDKEDVSIDVNSLFHRLVIVAERSSDIQSFFNFELTHHPTSLFANGLMRKPDKPALCRSFTRTLAPETLPLSLVYVVDGGCLLHKVRWQTGKTVADIIQLYASYVINKFGNNTVIIFDGYGAHASTKDHEHKRRSSRVAKVAPDVSLELNKRLMFDQESFLANTHNKEGFIVLLQQCFRDCNIPTVVSEGDADTGIVSAALQSAVSAPSNVAVFAEDTDILALLLFHRKPHMGEIYLISDGKKSRKVQKKL
jgi:hypothetical protein